MSEKYWNMKIVLDQQPSKVAVRVRSELRAELFDPSDSDPDAEAWLYTGYKSLPDDGVGFVNAMFAEAAKRVAKFGLTQTGARELSGTSIPDGKTRKIYRAFVKGFDDLIGFGEKHARGKGRSSEDDFDDDGKEKKDKKNK